MTKKLTEPAMELDLDSFLDSDDELSSSSIPHRTVDEILNDRDSSTSSDSEPEKSQQHQNNDAVSSNPHIQTARPFGSSFTRPGDPFSFTRRGSHPLPALFGSVRSNVKPGEALAAAAAASRSVPTPYATAIKLRKANGGGFRKGSEYGGSNRGESGEVVVESLEGNIKVEDGRDGGDEDQEDRVEGASDEGKLVVGSEDRNSVSSSGSVAECDLDRQGSVERKSEEGSLGVINDNENLSKSDLEVGSNENLDRKSSNLSDDNENSVNGLFDGGYKSVEFASGQESPSGVTELNVVSLDLNGTDEGGVLGSSVSEEGRKNDEEVTLENEELEAGVGTLENNEVVSNGEDGGSLNDINELVEEIIGQLETDLLSKRDDEGSQSSKKLLELAEELEKKQAFTGLHWEEGAAAQPMRLEGVRRGSITLGYFDVDADNTITRKISSSDFRRDFGSALVLAVNWSYIAVGMSKGFIAVVSSKYSFHTADNMDAKMMLLGDRSFAPVTSICFSQQGELLLAGYGDGRIILWDVQRASAAKVISGEHTAPVVHTLFLGQDSQGMRQFRVITGDSKGQVLLHNFSVRLLVNAFSVETQCLVDGQRTGTVLSASALLSDELASAASLPSVGNAFVQGGGIGSMMGGVVGADAGWKLFNKGSSLAEEDVVVFVTHQNALVVKLPPKMEVYGQLPKPDGVREGSMPYTAWKSVSHSRGSSADSQNEAVERVSLLAIAWDRKVQIAKLVKSELKVLCKWPLESTAIGVAWLDDQMLVVLTSAGKLSLFTKDGTMIHETNFAVHGGVDDVVTYHTHFINIYGNPEKSYHNCVAVRGASIYILGPTHLVISRLLPWKERIQVLRRAGDWMGALNMAMTLYDGQAHGVIDLPRTLEAVQKALMPYLEELLFSYVDEVFSYISLACHNQYEKTQQVDDVSSRNNSANSEIKEQFTRVGGVAVEFCVHINRTDILFDEIFSKFVAFQQRDTFLELLEPYILKDMLGSLPPEIMQALVEHYSGKGWLQRVEQCVLHMDISSLDFNQVVRLCQEHGLYGALVYLFNKGLDDFRTPLEELLRVLKTSEKGKAVKLGYRLLVYLKYSFLGLAFPPGHGNLHPSRVPSLRIELVQFLLEVSNSPPSEATLNSSTKGAYLNLYYLLEIDTEATLDVLRCAFLEDEVIPNPGTSQDIASENIETNKDSVSVVNGQNCLIQDTVDAFVGVLNKGTQNAGISSGVHDMEKVETWPAAKDLGQLFEFIAYYVTDGRAKVSKDVLSLIVEYYTTKDGSTRISTNNAEAMRNREKQLLALLKAVPEMDWNPLNVLQLCENVKFYQICGFVHSLKHQFVAALDSYIKDRDDPVHAFAFIHYTLQQLPDPDSASAFRSAVISRFPKLVELSRECSFLLVMDHFKEDELHILNELRSHPNSLFLYLKTVIEAYQSGTLNFSYLSKDIIYNRRTVKDHPNVLETYLERISDFPKFLRNNPVDVTDGIIELYLELLCQFERHSVLKFLETFDNYRVENCLRLCQEYGIIDAAAFLLERVGDAGSALLLTLSCLSDKFVALDTAVGNVMTGLRSSSRDGTDCWCTVSEMKERNEIHDILQACIRLCQRNTPRLNPHESESLWFKLLDSFCEPMMDSSHNKFVTERSIDVQRQVTLLEPIEGEVACTIDWRISKSNRGANILKRLFSEFIKDIVEGMIGYVPLPTIMSKLLLENGGQEFGDFKSTILGMLGTYGFERRIMDTAKSLIEDDTFYTMSILKKEASHGYAPRFLMCCICNCSLTKTSSSPSIRVFNCGHATHIHCEVLESETSSRDFVSGCPVCMPKKNPQKSSYKSVLADNSLVNYLKTRPQPTPGNFLHSHDSDSAESSYGLQQISRFEILSNLHKGQKSIQIENMPQLRLAPPAVYHEKVKNLLTGESSKTPSKVEGQTKNRQLKDIKVKGSSLRLPLKSSIFGKDKSSKH